MFPHWSFSLVYRLDILKTTCKKKGRLCYLAKVPSFLLTALFEAKDKDTVADILCMGKHF